METLSEATERVAGKGYTTSLRPLPVTDDGSVMLAGDGRRLRAGDLVVDEIVRFEGESSPDDEAMLFALREPRSGLRGTLVVAFGPVMPPDEAAVVQALRRRGRDGASRG